VDFVFAVHLHQPLGNFDHVIDEAVERSYLPLLDVLDRHPGIRVDLHISGCLFEWLEMHRTDVLDRLAALGDRVEWMSGGFYEPILGLIPEHDRVEQIERMTAYLKRRFGHRPRGMWLAERVWEPSLAATLAAAGMSYTVVDDRLLRAAGSGAEHLGGYVTADHFGRGVALFPIWESLRMAIPHRPPEDVLAMMHEWHRDRPEDLAVMGDDGEKFGLWPASAATVDEGGWLDRFFDLVDGAEWLRVTTFEAYLGTHRPRAHVAVPPGSYGEMNRWTLPPSAADEIDAAATSAAMREILDRHIAGAGIGAFGVRYPEVGVTLHKMWRLSEAIADAGGPREARVQLLRAQCNCAYWHGWFGGLYLPHLRADVQQRLIDARSRLDAARYPGGDRTWGELEVTDWDGDLSPEVVVELPLQSWVIDPAEDGALLFLDDKPSGWSLGDVIARRAVPGSSGRTLPHRWFADVTVPEGATVGEWAAGNRGAVSGPSSYRICSAGVEGGSASVVLDLPGRGVSKHVDAGNRTIRVAYDLADARSGRFGTELPVSVWAGAERLAPGTGPGSPIDGPIGLRGSAFTLFHDGRGVRVSIRLEPPGELWARPLITVSGSETGAEEIRQGVELFAHWPNPDPGRYSVGVDVSGG
jgi:hypothetical protein